MPEPFTPALYKYLLGIIEGRIAENARQLPCTACTACQWTICRASGALRFRQIMIEHPELWLEEGKSC